MGSFSTAPGFARAAYPGEVLTAADGPNYADIMQGWGSILSLPLALGAMVFTGLLLRHELRTRREERYLAKSAQARLLRVEGASIDDGFDKAGTRIRYHIHNRSDRPFFDVHVRHIARDGMSYALKGQQIQIEAGEARPLSINNDPQVATAIGDTKLIHGTNIPYVLVFTDAEGLVWFRRNGSGSPEPMLREPQPEPRSLFGLLVEVWGIRPKFRSFVYQLGKPRREAKNRLRAKIWRKQELMVERAIDGLRSYLAYREAEENRSRDLTEERDAAHTDQTTDGKPVGTD